MTRSQDPAAMDPDARLAELAALLATGYRRYRLSVRKALELPALPEGPCERAVATPENDDAPEEAA